MNELRKKSAARFLWLIAALLLASCKSPTAKDVAESMVSWLGTADMASQAWLNGTTLDRFTERTLELAAEHLKQQAEELSRLEGSSDTSLSAPVMRARVRLALMAAAVRGHDAPDFRRQLDSLRADKQTVLAAADSMEKRQ